MISMVLEWIEIDDFDDDFGDDVMGVLSDIEMNVTKEQIIMKRKSIKCIFFDSASAMSTRQSDWLAYFSRWRARALLIRGRNLQPYT